VGLATSPTYHIVDADRVAGVPAACSNQITLPDAAYIAHIIRVTPQALTRQLAAGKTVLQIAGRKYHSADALVTALLAPLGGKLPPGSAEYRHMHRAWARLVMKRHPPLAKSASSGKGKSGC
jgi:hypothetical protein